MWQTIRTDFKIDLPILLLVIAAHVVGFRMLRKEAWPRVVLWSVAGSSLGVVLAGALLMNDRIANYLPHDVASWARGMTMMWSFISVLLMAGIFIWQRWLRTGEQHSPARRAALKTASTALFVAPVAIAGYGTFIQRFDFRLREQDIHFKDLPDELNGLSLVQLTDIHLSAFLSERDLARVVDMANETKARVGLVTGDLITRAGDPLDACLNQLARLQTDAGTFGCMGNHERYAYAEHYVAKRGAELGMSFLRKKAKVLEFGSSRLNLAGVDYQPMHADYLKGTEGLIDPGAFNVLLSHNPDVFPVAAAKGFPLTLSGHTHGGQVRVEILQEDLNIVRFFTPYVDGLYRQDNAAAFVSRGIGTIGMPTRLGTPPEVALIRLWKS
jgi:hypothetical protein